MLQKNNFKLIAILLSVLILSACGGSEDNSEKDVISVDPAPDIGTPDTGTPDTGTPDIGTPDIGTPDTGTPDPDKGPEEVPNPETTVTPPVNFEVTATTWQSITLRWSKSEQRAESKTDNGLLITSYEVLRDGEYIATITDKLYTYSDSALAPEQSYNYALYAINAKGQRSEPVYLDAKTINNTAPNFTAEPTYQVIYNTAIAGEVVTSLALNDAENDSLSYKISTGNEKGAFEILPSGEVVISENPEALAQLGNKIVTLLLEVSDGYSITSANLKVGVIAVSAQVAQQGILRQVYYSDEITGSIDSFKNIASFPNSPDETSFESSFIAPADISSKYGQRMHGYLVPEESGDYTFWIASDDNGELSLSDSHKPESAMIIAQVSGYTSPNQWGKNVEQQSQTISLQAGMPYYISAVMSEGGGGDHLSIAWQGPGIDQEIIAGHFLRAPLDTQVPTAPTNVTAFKSGNSSATLSWDAARDNNKVTDYSIFHNGELLGSSKNTTVELIDLLSGKRYNFTVIARDEAGNTSGLSNTVSLIIDDHIAPSAPTNLQVQDITSHSININWHISTDERDTAVLYRIYQNDLLVASSYKNRFSFTGLSPETEYQFNVAAVDDSGNSNLGATVLTVTTPAIDPELPRFNAASYHFSLVTSSEINYLLGLVSASDAQNNIISYSITSGNEQGYFTINYQGEVTLAKTLPTESNTIQPTIHNLTITATNSVKSVTAELKVIEINSATLSKQGLAREIWTGIGGSSISNINLDTAPNTQNSITHFETSPNIGSNYAQRIRGFLIAPVSGSYNFWIASDDSSQLHLSADMDPEKTEVLARVNGYTSIRNWRDNNTIKQDIELHAGQLYYIEALHKEGGGGDHLSVAWQTPDMTEKSLITSDNLLPYSALVPVMPKLNNGMQTDFKNDGSSLQLELEILEQAADFPIRIYYGLRDGGTNATEWQYVSELYTLGAGLHTLTLNNIEPGQEYFVRIEAVGVIESRWSSSAFKIKTVTIDPSKVAGEALPNTLSFTLEINGEAQHIELNKHSVRSPNFQLLTYDERRQPQYAPVVPMPEPRTYRGYVSNNPFIVVTGVIDNNGTIHMTGWRGDGKAWGQTKDVSAWVNSDALGNSESATTEIKLDFQMPEKSENTYYIPEPGNDFHNNLARVSFSFQNTQYINRAEGKLLNAIAQMENHVNETDYLWAQKTGLRWDLGRALINVFGTPDDASGPRPSAIDSSNFSINFQDPRNGGYCWGGGDWVGCVANYTLNWGFSHEVGHNMGLGHGEQADNANQMQTPGTQLGNMQARKTTARLQKGSKFRPAKAVLAPMLPAAFKDYATVFSNATADITPLANDYDANGDTISIDTFDAITAEGGTVTRNGDTLQYTPQVDFIGTDQFTYTVTDGTYKTVGPVQIQVLTTINDHLAGAWDMESASGEFTPDLSGQGNHLYAYGKELSNYIVGGIEGEGLAIPMIASKDSAKDALGHKLLPHRLDPGHNSFTASIWFQYSDMASNKLLMGKSSSGPKNMAYGGWEIRSEGNNLVMQVSYRDRLMANNTVVISENSAIIDGSWHHAAIVVDRELGTLKGYLDGQAFVTQGTLPQGNGPIMAAMNFTGYGGGSPFKLGGQTEAICDEANVCTPKAGQAVDKARVYHRALTELEVNSLFIAR